MLKSLSTFILTLVISFTLTGCFLLSTRGTDGKPLSSSTKSEACQQENVEAPQWVCEPTVKGFYSAVGIVSESPSGIEKTKEIALTDGRYNLAQSIKAQVKSKVENFIIETELGDANTASNVNKDVSKEIKRVNLTPSIGIANWSAPSKTLYMHVTLEEATVNTIVKQAVINSLKNDSVLWEKYEDGSYSKKLDKKFPTK